MDEAAVEIGEAKEELYVLDLLRHRPFLYYIDFSCIHEKSAWREDKSEVLNSLQVPFTLSQI